MFLLFASDIYVLTQTPSISSNNLEAHHTQIPADLGITDFGPLPRDRYPLVAVLTLAEPESRDKYIVSPSHISAFYMCSCLLIVESDDRTHMGLIFFDNCNTKKIGGNCKTKLVQTIFCLLTYIVSWFFRHTSSAGLASPSSLKQNSLFERNNTAVFLFSGGQCDHYSCSR